MNWTSDRFSDRFDSFCSIVNRVVELILAVAMAAMVVVIFLQVFFRYGLNSSLSWSEELARYLFIWVIFLGMASATRRGEHMAVTALATILPASALRPLQAIIILISFVFFAVVLYTTVLLTENAIPQLSTALEISVALVYLSAPIGAVLTLLHLVNSLIQLAAGRRLTLDSATDIS